MAKKSSKPTPKRYAVDIEPKQMEALQHYREVTGVPVLRAVNEALKDFLTVVVPVRLKTLGRK